jgi:Protein of unknown function (DUF3015)
MASNVTKRVLLAGLILGVSSSSYAKKYGMAGCGLGSLIIDPSGSQTSAATTNNTAYNQLFGISFGTSNCDTKEEMAVIMNQENFVVTNLSTLSKEMAQGKGESLAAFSATLGCSHDSDSAVARELQANYSEIFKSPGAMAVLDTSKDVLKGNPEISSKCQYLN